MVYFYNYIFILFLTLINSLNVNFIFIKSDLVIFLYNFLNDFKVQLFPFIIIELNLM